MSHTLTRTIRTLTFFAGSVLLIVACGGGGEKSSSDRQRNSVLCYSDQAEKDAAVAAAQAAFDEANQPPVPEFESAPSDDHGRSPLAFIGPRLWSMLFNAADPTDENIPRTIGAPTNLRVIDTGSSYMLLWDAPLDGGYRPERYMVLVDVEGDAWSVNGTATSFELQQSSFAAGKTVTFSIRSDNDSESLYSAFSNAVSVQTPGETPADPTATTVPPADEQIALQLALTTAELQEVCVDSATSMNENASIEHICTYEIRIGQFDEQSALFAPEYSQNCTVDSWSFGVLDQNRQSIVFMYVGATLVGEFAADFNGSDSVVHEFSYLSPSNEDSSVTSLPSDLAECSVYVDGRGAQFNCPYDIVTTFQFGSRSEEGSGSEQFEIDFMNSGDKFRVSAVSIDRGTQYFEFEYESGGTALGDVVFNVPSSLLHVDDPQSNPDCDFALWSDKYEWDCNFPVNIVVNGVSVDGMGSTLQYLCTPQGEDLTDHHRPGGLESYDVIVGLVDVVSAFSYSSLLPEPQHFYLDLPDNPENPSCQQEPGDYSNLEHSTSFTGESAQYDLVLTQPTNVVITANSFQTDCDDPENDPQLYIYGYGQEFNGLQLELLYTDDNGLHNDANCSAAFYEGVLEEGYYQIVVENSWFIPEDPSDAIVIVNSSVALAPMPMPITAYETTFDTREHSYRFTLAETTDVTFMTSSDQSCTPAELGSGSDEFITPESYLFTADSFNSNGEPLFDAPTIYGSLTNCAVTIIQTTLETGDYVYFADVNFHEGQTMTVGSSIELGVPADISFASMNTVQVDAVEAFEIAVPAGGLWMRAEGNTYQRWDSSEEAVYVDPVLILVDQSDNVVMVSDDDGETNTNVLASLIEIFLPEGNYRLIATTYEAWANQEGEYLTQYELRYGFGSTSAAPLQKIELEPSPNIEMPPNLPAPAVLPTSGLTADGSPADGSTKSISAISPAVSTMVCDEDCIDGLFASAGIEDGTIDITVGAQTVTVTKGQKKATVPVGRRVQEISVIAKSADGTTQMKLAAAATIISAEYQKALDAKTTFGVNESAPDASDAGSESGSSGSSKLPYVLVSVIALLGAAALINARRKRRLHQTNNS